MNSIFTRTSVRSFTDQPVSSQQVEQLLRAAMAAPSAGNQQPWEFYVVTHRDTIESLAQASPYAGCAAGAPVVIVPCARREVMFPQNREMDLSAAVENLLLEAVELGLGAVWLGIAPEPERMTAVARLLSLPDGLEPFALIPVGCPSRVQAQQDRFDPDRVHYIA